MSAEAALAPKFESRPPRLYHWLMEGCGLFSGLVLGGIAVLVTVDVICRNLVGWAVPWSLEVSEYGLPLATFTAAPWVLYHGAHVRIDILPRALPAGAARMLGLVVEAFGGIVSAVFLYLTAGAALQSGRLGSMVFKVLVFPEWWLFVPAVFCFALLTAEFARRFVRALRGAGVE